MTLAHEEKLEALKLRDYQVKAFEELQKLNTGSANTLLTRADIRCNTSVFEAKGLPFRERVPKNPP